MPTCYKPEAAQLARSTVKTTVWLRSLLALLGLLATVGSRAQAPGWGGAVVGAAINAVTTDVYGNVFVTGIFGKTVSFGSTVLTSQGDGDLFVAKYVPSTGT